MIGAHLDSWHSATGATDNADGAATVLEAMRILKAVGAQPRRTIRVALWGGEEEGLFGSKAWVAKHLSGDANKAARDKFSVYFNIDPGYGPIYGFYTEGNEAAKAIFDAWLEPFKDLTARKNIISGNRQHRSPELHRRGRAGIQSGAGVRQLRCAHPSHEHGYDGAHEARGREAGRDHLRHVCVQRRDARRADSACARFAVIVRSITSASRIAVTPRCVVHKFGGSSLADAGCFRRVADIVAERSEPRRAVVVSAMAGVTNALVSAVEMAGRAVDRIGDVLEEFAPSSCRDDS